MKNIGIHGIIASLALLVACKLQMAFSRQAFIISENTLDGGKLSQSRNFVIRHNLINLS